METNIITSLQEKINFYKEEIQKIETAIEVIQQNTGAKANEKTSEKQSGGRKEKASAASLNSQGQSANASSGSGRGSKKSNQKLHPSGKKPISKQVIEYLTESNHFLYPADIIETLAERSGKKPEAVKLLVNQTLSRLKKESKLVSFKSENSRSHAWGFQTWLEGNDPSPEHRPKTENQYPFG